MSIKLYHDTSYKISSLITKNYSTSFSLAINVFNAELKESISSIYGFVRLADEIVDSFHEFDKQNLLEELREDFYNAVRDKISINPVLNSFQNTVRKYDIPLEYVNDFIESMKKDLSNSYYERKDYDIYVYGSAEVVGLMCLKVFCYKNDKLFENLIPSAKALGSAFQKVNFLRDIKSDLNERGRIYFPGASDESMINNKNKSTLEKEIENEFETAYSGIKKLPKSCILGVYSAYLYYLILFKKIKGMSVNELFRKRVRISNFTKVILLFKSVIRIKFTRAFE